MQKSPFPSGGFVYPVRAVVSREVDDSGDVREVTEVLDCGHKARGSRSSKGFRRCLRCPPTLGKLYDPDALKARKAYEREREARRRSSSQP